MGASTFHGVNLTGWLTMEPWVTPGLFANSGALDEESLINAAGPERYHEILTHHREHFIKQNDFIQIAGRGFNAVRLTLPWYVFGEELCEVGPYLSCIEYVDKAFEWAEDIGLKILLVLGANIGQESNKTVLVHNHARFFDYRQDLLNVLSALASRYALRDGLLGIEVADEPKTRQRRGFSVQDGIALHELRAYYRDAYDVIRKAAGKDPVIVLPDAGRPHAWRSFMAQSHYSNVWLDSYLYHYTDKIDATGPFGMHRLVRGSALSLRAARKSGLPVMVGKWSGSLPYPDSLMTPEGRIALERVYISEQIAAFKKCPAWFFQTWKTNARLSNWDARVALATFERRMLD